MNLVKFSIITVSTTLILSLTSQFSFSQNSDSSSVIIETEVFEDLEAEFNKTEIETFGNTRIINTHSIETLKKGVLEFRIEHKFGDIAGTEGGVQTFFGMDNSTDIRFAFEYGITNDLMIGVGRSKGTYGLGANGSPYKSLLDGLIKYRLLRQKPNVSLISLSVLGTTSYTYMKSITDLTSVSSYPNQSNRFAYASQINVARKFGKKLSLAIMPTYVYRNFVADNDVNGLFSLGSAIRYSINDRIGVIVEYFQNFNSSGVRTLNTNSLGVAVEWNTFGHVFTVNLTNSVGFGETQFIPYTFQDWSKGQFRLGFCISRKYRKD